MQEKLKMHSFEWSDSYCTGISFIDSQHKEFFRIINEFEDSFQNELPCAKTKETLKKLIDYMQFHFQMEEHEMRTKSYPKWARHASMHEAYTREVQSYYRKFRESEQPMLQELRSFMVGWLTKHVLTEDMDFSHFLNAKKKK